ncbi:MAG: hypothetical protein H7255_13700 [Ramlibacter sp.]|nr:hypothetical protein [Ramlibacter sp.]
MDIELTTSEPRSAADVLQARLDHATDLRDAGRESDAIACGPAILEAYFQVQQARELPRHNPQTLTDKIYCRMLDVHERGCATFSRLSDKLAVRDYVAQRIDEKFLTPVLWSGDDAREIPWARLPDEFVLKCNEGSGKGLLMLAPHDRDAAQTLASEWLAESFYWRKREFHYWNVPRRLLVEPRLDDGHPDGPIDYNFFCFDGVPRLLQVGSRSHTIHRFFTPDWEPIALTYRKDYLAPAMPRPAPLAQMLDIAAKLSTGFDFVRVDLFCCKQGRRDEIRFGELTFTPCAGRVMFEPREWDARVGEWWRYSEPPQ